MGTNNVISQILLNEKMSSNYDDYKYKINEKQGIFGSSNAFKISPTSETKHVCTYFESEMIGPMLNGAIQPSIEQTIKTPKISTVRRNFPEVWIYQVNETSTGVMEINQQVPDSITSWMISGFSINQGGFAIAEQQKISVFQDFFVKIEKPSSVKLSEIVSIKVIIYNYTPNLARTTVNLVNRDGQFDFINGNRVDNSFSKLFNTQVKSGSTASVVFKIKPKVKGKIFLKVQASTNTGVKDEIEDTLMVETPGINKHITMNKIVDLKRETRYSEQLVFRNLSNAVEDSVTFEVVTTTDLIGPAIDNIHNLM